MDRALIVDKRYDEYRQKVHLEKLSSMRPATNTNAPPSFSHLQSQQKKQQMTKDRLSKVDYENRVLVKKLAEITRKPSAIDNHNPDFSKYKKSLNKEKRQKDLDRITAENYVMSIDDNNLCCKAFVKRMIENPPSYNQTSWQDEREKQLKYLKNSSQYPVLQHHVNTGSPNKNSTKEVTITLGMQPMKLDSKKSPPRKIDPLKRPDSKPLNLSSNKTPISEDEDEESEEEEEDSMDISDSEEEKDE